MNEGKKGKFGPGVTNLSQSKVKNVGSSQFKLGESLAQSFYIGFICK